MTPPPPTICAKVVAQNQSLVWGSPRRLGPHVQGDAPLPTLGPAAEGQSNLICLNQA